MLAAMASIGRDFTSNSNRPDEQIRDFPVFRVSFDGTVENPEALIHDVGLFPARPVAKRKFCS